MCGITGIVVGGKGVVEGRVLRAMTQTLESRGPDGEGYFIDGPVGLGHRRLAVIDVEGGQQPLFSEDRRVAVVVNGELYNFRALRRQLEAKGHRFDTRSDSEVLVHGYEEWGDEVLDKIEGMFALAVWDAGRKRLLLARDTMGEKPLFWASLPGGGLAFASELTAFKHCPDIDKSIDPDALARYLFYEYVAAPASMVKGVRKLEPGHKLVFSPDREPAIASYWDLPLVGCPGGPNAAEHDLSRATDRLISELRRSVRERLVSDVPLGIFLSGGIDSSAVTAFAHEELGTELRTFAIDFGDPTFDETPEARFVAQSFGTDHHEERLSPRFLLDVVPNLGNLLDEPLGDGSFVPTHLLSRFARQSVTVALGGDGGDELFSGYPTFTAERLANWLVDWLPSLLERRVVGLGRRIASLMPVSQLYLSLDFKLKQFLKGVELTGGQRHQAWLGSLLPHEAIAALSPELAREVNPDLFDVIDQRLERCGATNSWDRLLYFYAKGYLAESVLTKVDRASMAVGLEVRAPFLDRGVVSAACQLAPALRMKRLQTKHVLKQALQGLLPERTIHRKKKGFGMPIGRWLQHELRDLLLDELSPDRLREEGLFDPAFVQRLIDQHLGNEVDHRKPLWTLLVFQEWYRAWQQPV